MKNEILIFFHLPKAGGTTLNSILFNNIDKGKSWKYCPYEHNKELDKIKQALHNNELRCITGHMAFGLHKYTENYKYITLLREPVSRVISYYKHFSRLPVTCKDKFVGIERTFDPCEAENWSIDDLLKHRISSQIHNGYVRFFAGSNGLPISLKEKSELSESDLNKAKKNLADYFSVVAITEEYDKSLLLLRKFAGLKNIFYVKKNQAPQKTTASALSPETVECIKKNNQLDIQFYKYAKELMMEKFEESSLNDEFLQFEADLAEYRRNYVTPQNDRTERINSIINGIPPEKKVAVYSCGLHTQKMFEQTNITNLNIQCILDTYQDGMTFEGLPVLNADKIQNMDIDTIIVSNFNNQDNILDYLKNKLHFKKEIISFYTSEDNLPFYEY